MKTPFRSPLEFPRKRLNAGKVIFALLVAILVGCTAWADQEITTLADGPGGFVDTIGINTHITTTAGDDAAATFGTEESMLGALGVRHIRATMHGSGGATIFPGRIDSLYSQYGIRSVLTGQALATDITVSSQAKYVNTDNAIEAMEG